MIQASALYPPGGFGAPKHRRGHARGAVGLPAGTEVFSADTHISLAADIFYERFPDDLKDSAPRIDRKSTRLNSSHCVTSRMPSSA